VTFNILNGKVTSLTCMELTSNQQCIFFFISFSPNLDRRWRIQQESIVVALVYFLSVSIIINISFFL
jgi:hypothetical protein